jgi:hypothetical protein
MGVFYMAQELVKMPKPEAGIYQGKRKLFLVPLIFAPPDQPAEFAELNERYWHSVQEHLVHLVSRLGALRLVYIEMLTATGEEELKSIEAINPKLAEVVRGLCQDGAQLTAVEDEQLVRESFDWQRCLMVGLSSDKVSRLARESYTEATRSRNEHIARRIDESLPADETGVLFIGEGHGVQFPSDVEVFYVAPPALDEIHRWFRERPSASAKPDGDPS